MVNYWLQRKKKKLVINEINDLLKSFIGKSIVPIDKLFFDMRKEVLNFFKLHNHKLKVFSNGKPFNYTFEIEEENELVINVTFQVEI